MFMVLVSLDTRLTAIYFLIFSKDYKLVLAILLELDDVTKNKKLHFIQKMKGN